MSLLAGPQSLCAQNTTESEVDSSSANGGADTPSQFGNTNIRLTFSYGWSNRLNSINDNGNSQVNDFEEELQTGQTIRASLIYFAEGNFGMGVKYSHFWTAHDADIIFFDDVGFERTVNVSEDINARFFGLSVMHREPIGRKFEINLSLAVGVLFLKSEVEGLTLFPITFNGDSFALDGELNFEYYLSEAVSMGIGAAINLGPIQEVADDDIILESFDFNRVDLVGGFRFHF